MHLCIKVDHEDMRNTDTASGLRECNMLVTHVVSYYADDMQATSTI